MRADAAIRPALIDADSSESPTYSTARLKNKGCVNTNPVKQSLGGTTDTKSV